MCPDPPCRQTKCAGSASDRRREGYPADEARPRSGLDRVARSRSEGPNPFDVKSVGRSSCCTIIVITDMFTGAITIGVVTGTRRALSS